MSQSAVSLDIDNKFANGCAWVEGEYVPIAEARIPLTDAGFTKSDCTYTVVAVWDGNFFRLDDHFDRFQWGWEKLRLTPPLSRDAMRDVAFECVRRSGIKNAYVELIATRGVPQTGSRDPRDYDNRFYAFAIPYVWIIEPDDQLKGSNLIVAKNAVRMDPRSMDPKIKNFHWGDLVNAQLESYDRNAEAAVLCNAAGEVTEGPGFNIFALCEGELWTPARGVLEGITRQTIIDLAPEFEIPVRVEMFSADLLYAADEIFITSTAGGVMPIVSLDGQPVGDGRPGETTLEIRARYWQAQSDARWATPVIVS
ncbi:MAG: aminotransferase class IV [Pseudomonadota bacterium]